MLRFTLPVLALGVLLSACSSATKTTATINNPAPPEAITIQKDCGASTVRSLTGTEWNEDAKAWINERARPSQLRVLEENGAATQDLRPGRLNILVGENKLIQDIRCG